MKDISEQKKRTIYDQKVMVSGTHSIGNHDFPSSVQLIVRCRVLSLHTGGHGQAGGGSAAHADVQEGMIHQTVEAYPGEALTGYGLRMQLRGDCDSCMVRRAVE